MAENRECFITIVTGAQGLGKTKRTTEELEFYIRDDLKSGRKARKVLIFDTNNEYGKYKTVRYNPDDPKDNGRYISMLNNIEIRRVAPFLPDGRPMRVEHKYKCLIDIMNSYRGGLILLEDINTYLDKNATIEVNSGLVNVRHRALDVILHLQSLSRVSTIMMQNVGVIRMHHQNDVIDRYRTRISNFDLMKIAQIIVDKQYYAGNKYFFIYVDMQRSKIIGVKKDLFVSAAIEYANLYKSSEIRKKGGNKGDATNGVVKELMTYYGN